MIISNTSIVGKGQLLSIDISPLTRTPLTSDTSRSVFTRHPRYPIDATHSDSDAQLVISKQGYAIKDNWTLDVVIMTSGWNFQFTELTKASAYPNLRQLLEVNKLLQVFLKQIPKQMENFNILDIGCGNGNITKLIASSNPNSNVLGIDISEPFIKQAVTSQPFENLEFRKMNFYAMDEIPDKSVDIVTSIYSFYVEQLSDISSLCRQIAKEIKVGGEIKFLLNTIAPKKGCQLPTSVLDGDRMYPITLSDRKGEIINFEVFGLLKDEVLQGLLGAGFGDIRVQRLECSEKIGTGYVYRDVMAVIDVIIDAKFVANELS